MPYFAAPTSKVMLSNLPALVYEILCRGWDFLGDVPGLGHLKEKVAHEKDAAGHAAPPAADTRL